MSHLTPASRWPCRWDWGQASIGEVSGELSSFVSARLAVPTTVGRTPKIPHPFLKDSPLGKTPLVRFHAAICTGIPGKERASTHDLLGSGRRRNFCHTSQPSLGSPRFWRTWNIQCEPTHGKTSTAPYLSDNNADRACHRALRRQGNLGKLENGGPDSRLFAQLESVEFYPRSLWRKPRRAAQAVRSASLLPEWTGPRKASTFCTPLEWCYQAVTSPGTYRVRSASAGSFLSLACRGLAVQLLDAHLTCPKGSNIKSCTVWA